MSHHDRYKIIPSVYLILEREGKFLLARRCNTGFEDGNYALVSGHAEEGETLVEGLVRETEEEASIKLNPAGIKLVVTMHRYCGDHQRLDFFFTAKNYQGQIVNTEPEKCDDMSWFTFDEIPENTIPYIKKAIECYRDGVDYVEFDWCKRDKGETEL